MASKLPHNYIMLDYIYNFKVFKIIIDVFLLIRGSLLFNVNIYNGISDLCRLYRVSDLKYFRKYAYIIISNVINKSSTQDKNIILEAFLNTKYPRLLKKKYLDNLTRRREINRDIIVLKRKHSNEKGVILLKYTAKFDLFITLIDLKKIIRDYYLVLEPSWAGYCDPSILMFIVKEHPVIVQCPEESDYVFIENLKTNLIPIRLGASDWVDSDIFSNHSDVEKEYDLIMVANWSRFKRHYMLFKALDKIRSRNIRVLLIGYNWGGRTEKDIIRERNKYILDNIHLEIKQNLDTSQVAAYLSKSKVFILLSKKEGANKALVEALFSNVPAIVYNKFIGGAKNKINEQTGLLSSDEELAQKILYMIDNYKKYAPRAWAIENTGSKISTGRLNGRLKEIAINRGEQWTNDIAEKINNPNLSYKNINRHNKINSIDINYYRESIQSLMRNMQITK